MKLVNPSKENSGLEGPVSYDLSEVRLMMGKSCLYDMGKANVADG
jgi:hypothetical protein